jgi:peptide/nickel transport system ATP-binding protein
MGVEDTRQPETADEAAESRDVLLSVRDLKVEFRLREGNVKAVDGISFDIRRGQTLGIIGESGSGKSVTAQAIMRLIPPSGIIAQGEIHLHRKADTFEAHSVDLTQLSPTGPEIREIRWNEVSMVFQEPMTSFSPVHTIADQITEAMLLHFRQTTKREARERASDLLRRVGIPRAET